MRRPWRGLSPWKLMLRGLVHLVTAGAVAWGAAQVVSGSYDLTEAGLADQEATIERGALVVLVVALAVAVYGLARVVVGIVDLTSPRRVVDGLLVGADERVTGDVLPGIVQLVLRRRRNRNGDPHDPRRRWLELVVETHHGHRTFTVSPRIFSQARPGDRVTVRASRFLGHVSAVEASSPSPLPSA